MDAKYYDKNGQWRSHFSSTAVYSTPLVHYPMPASRNFLSNDTIEKAKGYEGWLASKQKEGSIYAPERAFIEAGCNEKVFHAGDATQGYSNMRRALREVEENMIVRNSALGEGVYDEKVFAAAEATNGYTHMRRTVRGKDENMFGRNMMLSEGDQCSNKIYSAEAIYEFLNMRQAARQKEDNMTASNSALSDSEYGQNIYSSRAGRGHMDMKMDQEARQSEHMYGSSPFLGDDGHNRDMYSAEAGRGYTIIRQGARPKEDMNLNPLSPVIDDDEYHKMYSAEASRGYTIITKTARKKEEAIFALNPVLSDDDEYGRVVFVKPSIMDSTNTRKAVACGPWGGNSGDLFDDGVFTGIREIELTRTGCIISIKVCYDMEGKAVWGNRNGGNHEIKVDKIVLDYPSEYLTHISGYYGSTVLRGPTVIKSLTFHTNRRKYGPFGDEQGVSFSSAGSVNGKIVGFSGRVKAWYVTSIGVHVMEGKSPQPAYDLLNMIGMRICEVGTAREPDRWYAKKVYMKMVNK